MHAPLQKSGEAIFVSLQKSLLPIFVRTHIQSPMEIEEGSARSARAQKAKLFEKPSVFEPKVFERRTKILRFLERSRQ